MKCSICEKEIPVKEGGWAEGNNAQPVNDGRCCDECNFNVVIPARMQEMQGRDWEVEDSPGEHWLYLRHFNGYTRVVGEDEKWSVAFEMTGETGRLFAAAPELLAALRLCRERLAEWVDSGSPDDEDFEAVKAARKAIAKAEGVGDD